MAVLGNIWGIFGEAMRNDAVEIVGVPVQNGLLFSCEHGSARVPAPWRPRPADRRLLESHWGYDIGARHLSLRLAHYAQSCAVISRFSRLLIDPNRAPTEPSLILKDCGGEGQPRFNQAPDLQARLERFHHPFHQALDATLRQQRPRLLLSIHSFTPCYRGQNRHQEAGVLFDRYDDLALAWLAALKKEGLDAYENEPWSGKDGLIYSAKRHGEAHAIPYLELEIRQDLIRSQRRAWAMAARVWRAIQAAGL